MYATQHNHLSVSQEYSMFALPPLDELVLPPDDDVLEDDVLLLEVEVEQACVLQD
ncbi:MAG: hypothetical protein LBC61_02605 [Candidatus Peribacteria bacterium]|nr:hypothetical protein [Candidatus Peribacteria bacterium]